MLSSNQLRPQVDLPVWEWLRFAPVVSSAGLSCSCAPDNMIINQTQGRYVYYLINATNFWRYDTISDTYLQLATPPNAPLTSSSMRYAGTHGHFGYVISSTTNTLQVGLPFGDAATGFKVRIISGTGAGQERTIISTSDPIVSDFGSLTSASQASGVTTLTDTAKNWGSSYNASGVSTGMNNWVGYTVRLLFGTGLTQVRRILYNSATVLTIADVNIGSYAPWCNHPLITAPAAGTMYQIESVTLTVDTAWDIQPDNTSRFVVQTGGIWLSSGAAAAPFYTLQYYDVLSDTWVCKPAVTNMISIVPTDNSLERITENSTVWGNGTATGSQSTSTLQDTTQNWAVNQWAG